MRQAIHVGWHGLWAAAAATLLASCGGKLPTLEEAKETVAETVKSAPTIIDNGKCELTVSAAISTSSCYVKTMTFSAGRPAIVQFTSYKDPNSESFPSIMVRAELPAGATSLASGQTLSGQVFIQEKADGPVWHSQSDSPVVVSVTLADGKIVDATISADGITNSETSAATPISGSLHAIVQ
ncbi:MAG: hypothetical protein AB7O62_01610 [Pirellulales bacterium]